MKEKFLNMIDAKIEKASGKDKKELEDIKKAYIFLMEKAA